MKNKLTKTQTRKTEAVPAKTPFWFYSVPVLIPVLFFILLEIGLRVFNYGTDYTQFITINNYPDKYFLNPAVSLKYFSNLNTAPGVINDAFDIEKKKNAFRVFVLGGSSTAGWPYVPNASFSRQLKRRLELLYPENIIEVINCGISAINSYTIRDFVPAIIKQKPDLILIYAGHNEYYGALGAGSAISMGQSRFLKNAYITLMDYKTTQLLRDFVGWLQGFFSSSEKIDKPSNETLMGKMIGESLIPLNSDTFNSGIEQFRGNFKDILKYFKDAGIPVIVGTLSMNIKDVAPFISAEKKSLPSARKIYNQAKLELEQKNIVKAKELFIYAKELDALRFRAPEKINKIIKNLAGEFANPVALIDSAFDANSRDGIVGYNLTVDHLHPTEEGYLLIAKTFFNKMEDTKYLPAGKKLAVNKSLQDTLLAADFPVTRLDSVIAQMRLAALTGSYPFVPKGAPNVKLNNFQYKDWVDSMAIEVINLRILWASAHSKLAERFFKMHDYKNFAREMNAIVEDRPVNATATEYAANKLIETGQINLGEYFLKKLHRQKPSFFSYKWLGQIALERKNVDKALSYLSEAVKLNSGDAALLYNIAGAYYLKGDYKNALNSVEKSLNINPKNLRALNFYNQLKAVLSGGR